MEVNPESLELHYHVGELIGSGQYAVVKRVKQLVSNKEFAAKFIHKKRVRASRRGVLREEIEREVSILHSCSHSNIIQLYDIFETKNEIILILELVSGGELFEYLSHKERVSEDEAVAFLRQILEGVRYLHQNKIIHLDLKPENIMLLNRDSTSIKLIDFGLSRQIKDEEVVKEMLGTPEFVAPEVINYDPLSTSTDMWSIGVITYILLSGCSPFLGDDNQETFVNVTNLDYSYDNHYFVNTSQLAKDFIDKLLVKDPMNRATAEDCLNHPWITPREKQHAIIRRRSSINVESLKSFLAKRRWQYSYKVVCICNRLTRSARIDKARRNLTGAGFTHKEEEEENLIMEALFTAVEEGNIQGIEELLNTAENYDINQKNKHGESALHMAASSGHLEIIKFLHDKGIDLTARDKHEDSAIYWAARQGNVGIVQYLAENGVSLNTQNKAGEAAIHVAARYGHTGVIEYLCSAGADVNLQDKLGETVFHNVAWHGLPAYTCQQLYEAGCEKDGVNKERETPLHCAAARGNLDCVKVLLHVGAKLNCIDKRGCTPLHLACRRRHINIALLLLHAGCQFDIQDQLHETSLHAAAREGLLSVTQTLCAFGCRLDVVSKAGVTPLHLASRGGHMEVVRCLLLSGSEADLPNKEGVTAEIMALAQGHNDIAELLTKLKPEKRDIYMRQLMPTNTPLGRIKVKFFGHSQGGKTTLIDSLKCGYFGSFFRKARLSSTNSLNQQKQKSIDSNGSALTTRHHSLPTQLSYDATHISYTKGIEVHDVAITGAGDLSLWDYSGYDPYYMFYDHFVGDPNCIHVIVFSLSEPQNIQLAQVTFWLNFIKARIPPFEPIGPYGRPPWPAHIVLVATHADKNNCTKNAQGHYQSLDASLLLAAVQEKFQYEFLITERVFVVDAHLAMSVDLKIIRNHLGDLKSEIIQNLPCSNGLLDSVVATLPAWRKTTSTFPCLPWPKFVEFIRARINTLASEEHMKQLIHQLQLQGEVIYLETEEEEDLVVLNPRWLTSEMIGRLLSQDQIMNARPTGCFTTYDIQLMFPEADAPNTLKVLEALEVTTSCEVDGDIEYEFPCLNFVETLHGLWEKDVRKYPNPVYGGARFKPPSGLPGQLTHLFPRIQTQLRRNFIEDPEQTEHDLYQWHLGSKYLSGHLDCLVTLDQDAIEVKARGPKKLATKLFYFFEEVCATVEQVVDDCCPGLPLERHMLNPYQLMNHEKDVHAYSPRNLLLMQLAGDTSLPFNGDVDADNDKDNNKDEQRVQFYDLVCFGSEEVKENLTLGVDLHISHLNVHARRQLARRLDPPEPMGRDWCLLAVSLGLTETMPKLDNTPRVRGESRTDKALDEWARHSDATVSKLIKKLQELGRVDAVEALLNYGPLYRVFSEDLVNDVEHTTQSQSSSNNLSSVSR